MRKYRRFLDDAADLVLRHGGSLSGEHGDGQARGELLPKMFGPELMEAFREFKAIWDPDWKMNPGKVIEPYRPDENLPLGTRLQPAAAADAFHFPDDRGSFAYATERCVGVGECRRRTAARCARATWSTREEKHSTRGRARLLFEMMQGERSTGRLAGRAVKEALDLCLACKGCKGDCPVSVDMATYKAEFLSHYYEEHVAARGTPTPSGAIDRWARWPRSRRAWPTSSPRRRALSAVAKWVAGIAPERRDSRRSRRGPSRDWFRERPAEEPRRRRR